MSFLRGKSAKDGVLTYGAISAAVIFAGFLINNTCGVFASAVCVVFGVMMLFLTRNRYKKIAALSDEIDKVLHGQESYSFERFSEGELSILQCELDKMIVRLREQSDNLKNEKIYLSDSLADISHQIKTPLTSINLALTMLSEPELSEDRRLRLTRDVVRSIGRIEWLVSSLLKISRLDSETVRLQRETINVAALIRRAVSPLEIAMELRSQRFTTNISGDEEFYGDMAWSVEAVGNILKNCMEHTPECGEISVFSHQNSIFTEITISDTGPGFSPDDLPHLFERFYRGAGSSSQSVGIGLALSRMIIVSEGGTVEAKNRSTGGAVFTIRFYKTTV